MAEQNIYHEGERQVQDQVGVSGEAQMLAGAIQDNIPVAATQFVEQQTMAVFASLDNKGRVWASILFGNPGFLHLEDTRTLRLQRRASYSAPGDPLWTNLETNPQIGMLLIELISRRRLRVNGMVRSSAKGDYLLDVQRSYANCPKYIQRRSFEIIEIARSAHLQDWYEGEQLNPAQQSWIAKADTFYVASAHPQQGADASHRGGLPGFVKVLSPTRLRIPDFVGNNMFNTLGNFQSYPSAGLLFIDFEGETILQLSGRPRLLLDLSDENGETGGTDRFWEFDLEVWRESRLQSRLEWRFLDYSPHIPTPRVIGNETKQSVLKLKVQRTWMETEQVKGFQLEAADGGRLPRFEPGAHLPLFVRDHDGNWVERHYSLLSDPKQPSRYAIGVRLDQQGRGGSLYLHESVGVGDTLYGMPPKNAFPLVTDAEHTILLAGGIGITPFIAMLYALRDAGRSVELHYSARRTSDLAFRGIILGLIGEGASFYASREPGQRHLELQQILGRPLANTHVYVCGPRRMIVEVNDLAQASGWSREQIHFESFGTNSAPDDQELTVRLARSGESVVVPAGRSILETLLDRGMTIPHDCKRGECSLCVTRVLDGEPEHRDLCLSCEERRVSMCICVSRAKSDSLTLEL
ncbi:MAG: pyridoxamine 5'-phosphate oxidase family protein [Candidatus Thiodiazotropha sp.]